LASIAQATRAILFASATATTLVGRRPNMATTQGYLSGRAHALLTTESAPRTSRPSQVAIALLGNRAEPVLAARGVLAWDQSDPGRELTSRLEGLRVGHRRHDRGRHDHAEAWDRFQPLARRIDAMSLIDVLVEARDLHLNRLQLGGDTLAGKASIARQSLIGGFRYGSHQLLQSLVPLLGHKPEFGQVGAHRVDELRALAHQEVPRRCSISALCCATLLIGTKRIVGRVTASRIAAASAASFLPRLT